MEQDFISLKQLAEEIAMDRSHARRYVLGLGIEPKKRRTTESGGQLTLTVSHEESEFIKQKREEHGFLGSSKPVEKEVGSFYVIQLIPELDDKRIKLGFADDINQRLAQHRTSAPTAKVLKSWPCKRSWEKTVIDALSCIGGKLILNEVFEFSDVERVIDHADKLFSLLGAPSARIEVSPHSPYNNQ
ncbi:hypothetical protein G3480_24425 [Thiorhodococcus mannitoliphagus]|uniref:Uncharacterized protein n=1 Tax=Thiorhodococcus mannitoliphagus TaxID=329406 RepID=A0A6P1E230_9GAMM|nr:hypothetical protein [Thiorhodococcus mannitoliphagus]NEX23401.1 hypothetical protein [Thiorhodococcus mannitoliphagus]